MKPIQERPSKVLHSAEICLDLASRTCPRLKHLEYFLLSNIRKIDAITVVVPTRMGLIACIGVIALSSLIALFVEGKYCNACS